MSQHILILAPGYYTFRNIARKAGGTIFQYHQAHALKSAGYSVGVLAPDGRSIRHLLPEWRRLFSGNAFYDDNGVVTGVHEGFHWLSGRINAFQASWRFYHWTGMHLFKEYVERHGMPDILHAHNLQPSGMLAFCINQRYGIPYLITEHSSAHGTGERHIETNSVYLEAWEKARTRLAVSPHLATLLERRLNVPCEWVPNMLDPMFERIDESRLARHPSKEFTFCNIGSLTTIKNHALLIRAFSEGFAKTGNTYLRIVGGGHLENALRRLVADLQVSDRVSFVGAADRNQVLEELLGCDAFVLSSDYETFGVVLIEALACGKPVIAPSGSGCECIVCDHNGRLIKPGDLNDLLAAMTFMREKAYSYDGMEIRRDCLSRFGKDRILERLRTYLRP